MTKECHHMMCKRHPVTWGQYPMTRDVAIQLILYRDNCQELYRDNFTDHRPALPLGHMLRAWGDCHGSAVVRYTGG